VEYADGVRRSEYSCRSPILPLSLDEDTAQHRGYEMHRLGVIRHARGFRRFERLVAPSGRRSMAMTSSCFDGRFASGCGSGSGSASMADHS
jgi:hypothetical protein